MGLDSRDYYKPSGLGGFSFFPPVLKKILFANGIVFFIQLISQMIVYGYSSEGYAVSYEYILTKYFALNPILGDHNNFYVWQLLTYQFLHANFTHILFNMFMLWMFGMEIENIMGSKKFLIFYLACGIGAGLIQLFLSPLFEGGMAPTIGASGAVFGVMIAFAMFFPDRYVYVYFLIPVKAKYLIAFLVVIEFMSVGNQSLVAHLAHIGGAITAFFFILYDRRSRISAGNIFGTFKKSSNGFSSSSFRNIFKSQPKDIKDAKFYDINKSKKEDVVTEAEIDVILEKISKSGYQNLTDREKKILFEASKKK
ncbi:MAG: rhomboid family intramembrane serine protease [Ignavibacteriales bacterium]|nr:MAG: rhomboid family intramembrane serine protease [Ignavibacteriales bacterium]